MLNSAVANYLSKSKGVPFFYVVGDKEYGTILSDITEAGVAIKRLSDFCLQEDKYPDLDMMVDFFRTADVNYSSNKWVLVGLGEYLALRGRTEVDKILQKLKAVRQNIQLLQQMQMIILSFPLLINFHRLLLISVLSRI